MKIELLKNAFRSLSRQEEVALAALAMVPRKRRALPVAGRHFDAVNQPPEINSEELLSMAAAAFDPRRLTRRAAEGLLELLQDGEILSKDDSRQALTVLRAATEKDSTVDLIAFFQAMLPEAPGKRRSLAVLNDIAGHRFSAAS